MLKKIIVSAIIACIFIYVFSFIPITQAQETASVSKNILSTGKKLSIDEENFDIKFKHDHLLVDVKIDNPQKIIFNGNLYLTVISKDGKQVLQTMWNSYPLNHNQVNLSNISLGTDLDKEDLKQYDLKYEFIYNYLPPRPECLIPGRCRGTDEEIRGIKQLSEFLN